MTEKTSFNLANISKDDMDKVNVDLAAGGVAFKECYNMPVIPELVEREQPEHLREYFKERLRLHREKAASLGRMEYTPPAQK